MFFRDKILFSSCSLSCWVQSTEAARCSVEFSSREDFLVWKTSPQLWHHMDSEVRVDHIFITGLLLSEGGVSRTEEVLGEVGPTENTSSKLLRWFFC